MNPRRRVVLDVDTGTDDAGALLLAATHPALRLGAALATWGNTDRDQVARNTRIVLEACGAAADVPVHLGATGPSGPTPFEDDAAEVMGTDGLGDIAGLAEPTTPVHPEPAPEALVRLANDAPGELTLVALAPLTTVAAALALDPDLPAKLHRLVVMGGAVAAPGNVTPAAEANIAHDPDAAAAVIDAFGAPGPHARPRLVPLDVTRPGALTRAELDALTHSPLPGAGLVHRIFDAAWPTGLLETGRPDVWPAHDLLAAWCAFDPDVCRWETMPLAVDRGGDVAWGATVADRSIPRKTLWGDPTALAAISDNRWDVAMEVDADRYHAAVRAWLTAKVSVHSTTRGGRDDA